MTSHVALERYRAKRDEWFELLRGDREHCVWLQISGMMWADAGFRAVNEARKFGSPEQPTAAAAPLLGELLTQGYVATMILAISKLTDAGGSDPKKGVISLRRVIDDIIRHRSIITREMFVCHDGLPFDPAAAARDYHSRNPPVNGAFTWLPSSGPEAFAVAARAHDAFDQVAETEGSARTRGDLISEQVLEAIAALLDGPEVNLCRDIRNKFVAHAADAVSRQTVNRQAFGITLGQIEKAQRAVVKAHHRVLIDVFWDGSGGPVPTPQFDQFRDLDRVFVPTDKMQELRSWWNAHTTDREKWTR